MLVKIAVLSISILLISFVSVSGVFPTLAVDLGLTQMQSELLMTIPAIAVIIFIFIANALVKRIGMKKLVIIGMLTASIAGIFPAFVQSFTPILISRFFLGAGAGLVNTWAVRYITLLFEPKESATLMGFRSSVEIFGQMVVAALAGVLFRFGWHISFLAYAIGFISVGLIGFFLPDVKLPPTPSGEQTSDRMPFVIYLLAAFCAVIVITAAGIAFRFPAMATAVRGTAYNPNIMMATWPILSIAAALTYGKLSLLLGKKLLYIALSILIIASFMTGFSADNYWMLIVALFLHGVVPAWLFPFIFMTAAKITTGRQQSTAFSYIVIGIKAGVFLIPFIVSLIETIFVTTDLTAPYRVLGFVLVLAMILIAAVGNKIIKKAYL